MSLDLADALIKERELVSINLSETKRAPLHIWEPNSVYSLRYRTSEVKFKTASTQQESQSISSAKSELHSRVETF